MDNKMKFVLKKNDIVTLEIYDAIQLTMRLDMTTDEFFADDGETNFIDRLAAVLGIPTYRIRIVDSYTGSTVLYLFIIRDDELAEGAETNVNAMEELARVEASLVEKTESGALQDELDMPIISVQSVVIDTTVAISDDGTTVVATETTVTYPGGKSPDDIADDPDKSEYDDSSSSSSSDEADMLSDWQIALIAILGFIVLVGTGVAVGLLIWYYKQK
jgi:hypothetical protein